MSLLPFYLRNLQRRGKRFYCLSDQTFSCRSARVSPRRETTPRPVIDTGFGRDLDGAPRVPTTPRPIVASVRTTLETSPRPPIRIKVPEGQAARVPVLPPMPTNPPAVTTTPTPLRFRETLGLAPDPNQHHQVVDLPGNLLQNPVRPLQDQPRTTQRTLPMGPVQAAGRPIAAFANAPPPAGFNEIDNEISQSPLDRPPFIPPRYRNLRNSNFLLRSSAFCN